MKRKLSLNEFHHQIDYDLEGFKWDEHVQAMVLGSFFWLHWTTQLPGGVLAAKYGTKFVFGFSNFLASVICIVMPLICYLDYRWMIFLRLLQGFMTGLSMPGNFFVFLAICDLQN